MKTNRTLSLCKNPRFRGARAGERGTKLGLFGTYITSQLTDRGVWKPHVDDVMHVIYEGAHICVVRSAHQRRAIQPVEVLDQLSRLKRRQKAALKCRIEVCSRKRKADDLDNHLACLRFLRFRSQISEHSVAEFSERMEGHAVRLVLDDALQRFPANTGLFSDRRPMALLSHKPRANRFEFVHATNYGH